MGVSRTAAGADRQPSAPLEIPLWLTLQRCRGVGWLHAARGGCLGLGDWGRGAAVFSRVVLVPPVDEPAAASSAHLHAGGSGGHSGAGSTHFSDAKKLRAPGDLSLGALDKVAAVEVEVAADEAEAEGGYGDRGGLYAALISSSVPAKEEAETATSVHGEFVIMHHIQDEQPPSDDGVDDLHLCVGELLWHPMPPRLFACRSMWSSPQLMRLKKSTDGKLRTDANALAATGAAGTAAGGPVFVLSDVDESDVEAATIPLGALKNIKGFLGDREAFRRAVTDTISLSASSIRRSPETISRLSNAAGDVFLKASADWLELGSAAMRAAAAAGGRVQKFWQGFIWRKEGGDEGSSEIGGSWVLTWKR
ncbi:hypothetical protein Efla_004356 [Eimeria flavescens]